MSKKRAYPSSGSSQPDVLGGDTPEMKDKEFYASTDTVGKDKDTTMDAVGKCKDSTPKSQSGKEKDAASSPGEAYGKYPMGAIQKKKQASSPQLTPEDDPIAPASSPRPSGGTVQDTSQLTNRTQLSEDGGEMKSKVDDDDSENEAEDAKNESDDAKSEKIEVKSEAEDEGEEKSPSIGSPQEDLKPLKKRTRIVEGQSKIRGSKAKSDRAARLKKVVRKGQVKHQRSFSTYIMKILKDVDSTKRINAQAMMINDSFANDLADRIILAATQLVATSKKKQLGSAQIIAAVKLVLPPDMARDAQRCIEASVKSYKELTHQLQDHIHDVDKLKEKIKGDSTPK